MIYLDDCLDVMRGMADDSVDAIVADPPSGTHFMGVSWDHNKGSRDAWIRWLAVRMAEALRVAKPGARALVWAIPRTSHWTGMAIEDAGWIIEDRVSHIFGQGFPKAKSKLKPACEDWWLARKASKNVPPLNIDDCRIEITDLGSDARKTLGDGRVGCGGVYNGGWNPDQRGLEHPHAHHESQRHDARGRWPANVALSCCGEVPHTEGCPVAILDEQSGILTSGVLKAGTKRNQGGGYHGNFPEIAALKDFGGDSGGASRFFYCSKASPKDRGEGNTHPTVKSTELLSWLIRLISNPGDTVLDPFAGSGTTGLACLNTGRHFIGIESDPAYFAIAERRLDAASNQTPLFAG
jgi:DNA modification methylase